MAVKFHPGQMVATPGAMEALDRLQMLGVLARHVRGDWGDVDAEDWETNDRALREGERLLSAYTVAGIKVWVITEADRSATTVLLPEEY